MSGQSGEESRSGTPKPASEGGPTFKPMPAKVTTNPGASASKPNASSGAERGEGGAAPSANASEQPGLIGRAAPGTIGGAIAAGLIWAFAPSGADPETAAKIEAAEAALADTSDALGEAEADLAQGLEGLAALESENAALRADLDALSTVVAAIPGGEQASGGAAASRLEEIADQLAELDERAAAMESRLDERAAAAAEERAAIAERVEQAVSQSDELGARMDDVESLVSAAQAEVAELADADDRAVGAALALAETSGAIEDGEPFASAVALLEPLSQDDPVIAEALEALAPVAESGVATDVELAGRLDEVAASLTPEGGGEDGWLGQAASNLSSLVDVNVAGASDEVGEALLAARAAIEEGDLPAAIERVEALGGEAASAWAADARARVAAEGALETLSEHVKSLLTARP